MGRFIALLLLLAAVSLVSCQTFDRPQANGMPPLHSFEFLGCSGDWHGKLGKPQVWRLVADSRVSFLTHQVATCGLSGRRPAISSNNGTLNLTYELYAPSDAVVMCDCEYWAKFTFGPEASGVKSVTVGGQPAELRGDWPGR
jgi:hypothetical protein